MGIEIHEWPPGAVERATLIARSLLECSNGSLPMARGHLVTLIVSIVLPNATDKDANALADQVLAQPEFNDNVGLSQTQTTLLAELESGRYTEPFDDPLGLFESVFGDESVGPDGLSAGRQQLLEAVERANRGGSRVEVYGDHAHPYWLDLELHDEQGNTSYELSDILAELLPYVEHKSIHLRDRKS